MMSSFRRTAVIVLLLALAAAVAVSVVEGAQSEDVNLRRELRKKGIGSGRNSSSASPPCLLTGTSMTWLASISSLLTGALLQDIM